MSGSRTVPVVIVNTGHAFPWLLGASAVLLILAFAFRRAAWARWGLGVGAGLCFLGAWLL